LSTQTFSPSSSSIFVYYCIHRDRPVGWHRLIGRFRFEVTLFCLRTGTDGVEKTVKYPIGEFVDHLRLVLATHLEGNGWLDFRGSIKFYIIEFLTMLYSKHRLLPKHAHIYTPHPSSRSPYRHVYFPLALYQCFYTSTFSWRLKKKNNNMQYNTKYYLIYTLTVYIHYKISGYTHKIFRNFELIFFKLK